MPSICLNLGSHACGAAAISCHLMPPEQQGVVCERNRDRLTTTPMPTLSARSVLLCRCQITKKPPPKDGANGGPGSPANSSAGSLAAAASPPRANGSPATPNGLRTLLEFIAWVVYTHQVRRRGWHSLGTAPYPGNAAVHAARADCLDRPRAPSQDSRLAEPLAEPRACVCSVLHADPALAAAGWRHHA